MNMPNEDLNSRLSTGAISTDQRLLHLLQIHDSAFPIGSYTQSFGLETYIQQDLVRTKAQVIDYCQSYLYHNLAGGDAILVQASHKAAKEKDLDQLAYLEQTCNAMKLAQESREGSIKMGKQFLQTILPLHESEMPFLKAWKEKIDHEPHTRGHYAILYGIYTALLDVDVDRAVLTFLYSSINGIIQNAVRGVPLGQHNGVQAMYALLGDVETAAKLVGRATLEDLHNNALSIEMASMQHEHLFSRLFIS